MVRGGAFPKMEDHIPVYNQDGTLWRHVTPLALHRMKNVRLCQNKRGYVHRAYLTGNELMRPLSHGNAGKTFEESTAFGPVWSMKMAPGIKL